MVRTFLSKHHLTIRVLPFALLLGATKWYAQEHGLEVMELNTYFSTLVAADVFLLGFLLSSAMPDYKEAEKIPGEMSAALNSIVEECDVLRQKPAARKAASSPARSPARRPASALRRAASGRTSARSPVSGSSRSSQAGSSGWGFSPNR